MSRVADGNGALMPAEVVRFVTTRQALTELGPGALTAAEERRGDSLPLARGRLDHRAAHLLVRDCVARLTGVDAGDVVLRQHCARCGGDGHGAPFVHLVGRRTLRQVHVSLSHAAGVVAAAASHHPVGVDVARVAVPDWRVGGLAAAESAWVESEADAGRAFLRLWTRKQALVKVGALELADAAGTVVLDGAGPAPRWRGWRLREWNALPGAIGCWASAP